MSIGTNVVEATRLRDDAIKRGYDAASARWQKHLDDAIRYTASILPEFTTDDIWDYFETAEITVPDETRSLGGAMKRAQAAGWIRPTDRVINSERPRCHRRPVRVWQSRIVED